MKKRAALALIALLAGCYLPDREQFKIGMDAMLHAGMPFSLAVNSLQGKDFKCVPQADGQSFRTFCARETHSVVPPGCVERVHLYNDKRNDSLQGYDTDIHCDGFQLLR